MVDGSRPNKNTRFMTELDGANGEVTNCPFFPIGDIG